MSFLISTAGPTSNHRNYRNEIRDLFCGWQMTTALFMFTLIWCFVDCWKDEADFQAGRPNEVSNRAHENERLE